MNISNLFIVAKHDEKMNSEKRRTDNRPGSSLSASWKCRQLSTDRVVPAYTLESGVALPRAINVGGTKKIAMTALVGLLADLGFGNGKSVLQTGNLVFQTRGETGAALESLLEAEAAKRLTLKTDFMV